MHGETVKLIRNYSWPLSIKLYMANYLRKNSIYMMFLYFTLLLSSVTFLLQRLVKDNMVCSFITLHSFCFLNYVSDMRYETKCF